VISRLNPIITGWAAYYRIGVSKRAYNALDAHLWRLAWKWAKVSHPNKPKRWIIRRYFGMFNPARQDKWVFGSRETGYCLRKFAWTKIIRHRMVAGRASPDDPALAGYWEQRRRRAQLPVDTATWHQLRRQHGRCPLCRGLLLHADHPPQDPGEWQQWHTATRKAIRKHAIASLTDPGTPDEPAAHYLIHAHCRRRTTSGSTSLALLPAREPLGLA
jgi:RNA-directed DNA polymerase